MNDVNVVCTPALDVSHCRNEQTLTARVSTATPQDAPAFENQPPGWVEILKVSNLGVTRLTQELS